MTLADIYIETCRKFGMPSKCLYDPDLLDLWDRTLMPKNLKKHQEISKTKIQETRDELEQAFAVSWSVAFFQQRN